MIIFTDAEKGTEMTINVLQQAISEPTLDSALDVISVALNFDTTSNSLFIFTELHFHGWKHNTFQQRAILLGSWLTSEMVAAVNKQEGR